MISSYAYHQNKILPSPADSGASWVDDDDRCSSSGQLAFCSLAGPVLLAE